MYRYVLDSVPSLVSGLEIIQSVVGTMWGLVPGNTTSKEVVEGVEEQATLRVGYPSGDQMAAWGLRSLCEQLSDGTTEEAGPVPYIPTLSICDWLRVFSG